MPKVTGWRLLGGGGIALGGLIWILAAFLSGVGLPELPWLPGVGEFLVGIGFGFLAFGPTGSNGIVGAVGWGKAALAIAGAALVVLGVSGVVGGLTGTSVTITTLTGGSVAVTVYGVTLALFVIAAFVGAVAIHYRGVAKGIARWVLFLPVVAAAFLWDAPPVGMAFLVVGIAYLLSRTDHNS